MKKLTPQDLFSIKLIESPRISPNGRDIVFIQKTFNPKANKYTAFLKWGHTPINSRPVSIGELTKGPEDSFPRFSPDGKQIAFLRKVGDFKQLFILSLSGRKTKRITRFKHDVSNQAWSPDGRKIAFTAAVSEDGLIPEKQKSEKDPFKKYNEDVKVIDRIWYKSDGDGFVHDKRSQIFLLDVKSEKIKQLTFGDHEAENPQFSPDGKSIVFSSNRNPDSDYDPSRHIYSVRIQGGEIKNLTPGAFCFTNPVFSPDGQWIAFTGYEDARNWYANVHLWVIPSKGGKPKCLTPESDFCVGDQSIDDLRGLSHGETPAWSKDSRSVYAAVSDRGKTYLIGVDLKTNAMKKYAEGNHVVNSWHVSSETDRSVICISDPTTPNDLWSLDLVSGESERLTEVNSDFRKKFSLAEPLPFLAKSADGTLIDAWILKPPHFREGKKYPAVLEIHGGPMAMYGWGFFYEFQLLASQGYVIVYSNPRGSLGYGQPFCEAIKGDWGNLDYQDATAVLEQAIQKGFIDENRLGVAGGSYGGFMTNWVIGHTDRFKAAITMRSVTNEYSMFGTSDYGFWGELNMGCLPWEKPETYLRMSPLSYVEKIKTPLLILHSEEDLRCPMEQAEQLFTALKKLKREVLFIRFPGESHDLSRTGKPWHRVYRLDRIVSWFKKHL